MNDRHSSSHNSPVDPKLLTFARGMRREQTEAERTIWSRVYVDEGELRLDLGRAGVVALPEEETQRRWDATTPQWPIMHAVTYGVSRDQMMARHKANHIHVAYANSVGEADRAMFAKAAMAEGMGMKVALCGTRKDGRAWE